MSASGEMVCTIISGRFLTTASTSASAAFPTSSTKVLSPALTVPSTTTVDFSAPFSVDIVTVMALPLVAVRSCSVIVASSPAPMTTVLPPLTSTPSKLDSTLPSTVTSAPFAATMPVASFSAVAVTSPPTLTVALFALTPVASEYSPFATASAFPVTVTVTLLLFSAIPFSPDSATASAETAYASAWEDDSAFALASPPTVTVIVLLLTAVALPLSKSPVSAHEDA